MSIESFRTARSPEELEQAIAALRPGALPSLTRMLDEVAMRAGLWALVVRAGAEAEVLNAIRRMAERTVARLVEGWAAQRWSPWAPAEEPPPSAVEPHALGEVQSGLQALQFTDTETLLLKEGSDLVERSLEGERLRSRPAQGGALIGFRDGRALVRGWVSSGERVDVRSDAIAATRASYRAMGLPTDDIEEQFPETFEGESVEETLFALDLDGGWRAPDPTAAWLDSEPFTELPRLRRADGATALLLVDRAEAVQSRDLGLVWLGERVLEIGELREVTRVNEAGEGARAVGRSRDGGIVCRAVPGRLACLDATAERLASVEDDTVQVVRVEDGSPLAQFGVK